MNQTPQCGHTSWARKPVWAGLGQGEGRLPGALALQAEHREMGRGFRAEETAKAKAWGAGVWCHERIGVRRWQRLSLADGRPRVPGEPPPPPPLTTGPLDPPHSYTHLLLLGTPLEGSCPAVIPICRRRLLRQETKCSNGHSWWTHTANGQPLGRREASAGQGPGDQIPLFSVPFLEAVGSSEPRGSGYRHPGPCK